MRLWEPSSARTLALLRATGHAALEAAEGGRRDHDNLPTREHVFPTTTWLASSLLRGLRHRRAEAHRSGGGRRTDDPRPFEFDPLDAQIRQVFFFDTPTWR